VLTACGGAEGTSADPGRRPDLPAAAASARSALRTVTVWDIGEREWVQLAKFLPAEKPVLVWFWAPH